MNEIPPTRDLILNRHDFARLLLAEDVRCREPLPHLSQLGTT